MPNSNVHTKQMAKSYHKKHKSEGTTPIGGNYMKTFFHGTTY